jgi:hypothetical protein
MFTRRICPETNKDSKMNSSRRSVARVRTFRISHNDRFRGLYLGNPGWVGSSTTAFAFGTVNLFLAALSLGSFTSTKLLSMIGFPSANPAILAQLLRCYTETLR